MLSYRHGFHAGNFADVLKHLVQVETLIHMCRKDKPFDYIDTHAGAGLYQLHGEMAAQNREYQNGIDCLLASAAHWPALQPYLEQVRAHNADEQLRCYPGSPAIAAGLLRPQDKAWLFELHPADFANLQRNVTGANIHLRQADGFAGLNALLPTRARRALVLIDPPYELKEDYRRVVDALKLIHRRMATATIALWYPVVERPRIQQLEQQLIASGIRRVVQFELGVRADKVGRGMTSSGMIVVNPPWQLLDTLQALLPKLARLLSEDGSEHYLCRELVPE